MSAKWTFWAWEQPIKTAPKKLALLQLANNANDDGVSWYSIGKMANSCGVSQRTFQRHIQELENDGLLHVERRSNRPSIYTLKEEVEVVLHDVGCQSDMAGCQSDTSIGVRESHDLNSNPNTNPDSLYKSQIEEAFAVFYNAGMRKLNPKGALKYFTALCKKSKKEFTPIEIANHLANDVKIRLANNQMGFDKMHPTTYLNNERWNDERVQESNAAGNQESENERSARKLAEWSAQRNGNYQGDEQAGMALEYGQGAIPHKMD